MTLPSNMARPLGRSLRTITQQAQDMAHAGRQPLLSSHMLLTIFTVHNPAQALLRQFGVRLENLSYLSRCGLTEPKGSVDALLDVADQIRQSHGGQHICTVHVLGALASHPQALASRSLSDLGVDLNRLNQAARDHIQLQQGSSKPEAKKKNAKLSTTARQRPERANLRQRNRDRLQERSSPVHPALRDSWLRTTPTHGSPAIKRMDVGPLIKAPMPLVASHPELPVHLAVAQATQMDEVEHAQVLMAQRKSLKDRFAERKAQVRTRKMHTTRPSQPVRKSKPKAAPVQDKAPKKTPELPSESADEHVFVLPSTRRQNKPPASKSNAAKTPKAPKTPSTPKSTKPPEPVAPKEVSKQEAIEDARTSTRSLAARLFAKKTPPVEHQSEDTQPPKTKAQPCVPGKPNPELAAHYRLDPELFPMLSKFGRNLTEEAALARIDPVAGRDDEIARVINILGKRRGNNPMLVGEPGVGKTALVEGLAQRFCALASGGDRLGRRSIIELELGRLLSGTHLRGSFSERLIAIKDEVRAADGQVIIFLDEIHVWMNAGQSGDGADASGELKTALARGRFPCIGATTSDEYTRFIETDQAFQRRFQVVQVNAPDVPTTIAIAHGVRPHYESHHGVTLSDDAIEAAVRLSHRYIQQRQLPDKALNVLDMAASQAARKGRRAINLDDIACVVAQMSGIPMDRLTQNDRERFLNIEKELSKQVIGHEDVIHTVAEVLRRNYAGFRSNRPIGSMLFLGPTGVGKTETVKALADFLFHDRDAIVRLDMSEFMEAHAVSRFIGAPPGYIGYEQGGQLTEAVRKSPYQIVLLDEIEKAHPDILNILLQLCDEGRLTDGRGRVVDFSNTLIIMTSNLGADVFAQQRDESSRTRIGFGKATGGAIRAERADKLRRDVQLSAQEHFTPELWARLDERLVFMPLQRHEIAKIASLQLDSSNKRLRQDSGISLVHDHHVVELLIEHGGFDPAKGARPMRQTIQRLIESNIARLILANKVTKGDTIRITVLNGELQFQRAKQP